MRLHAKKRASHLTWTGSVLVAAGVGLAAPEIAVSGAALLAGVALSRTLTLISVARARAAGFEMLWKTGDRTRRAQRLVPTTLRAELRNRDALPTRYRALTAMHSPALHVEITPQEGEIPPRGQLTVELTVTPQRVGYHGIHGLTLETIRAPGLFSVPLSFSNPFVVEVLPRTVACTVVSGSGHVSRHQAPEGGGGRLRGDGPEFRELREHRPGDPFRDIAWRASARRGRLLVVEKEQQQRDIVWLFLEASADAFGGPPGRGGIDFGIDAAMRTADGHLARGDLVGLEVIGSGHHVRVPLGRGPRHAASLVSTLSFETHCVHADRSDWDERDVIRRVLEHARSLDAAAADLDVDDVQALSSLASELLRKAPTQPGQPFAETPLDRLLRRYLLAFGIHPPAKTTSDRYAVERRIARSIRETLVQRPRAALVYVFAKPPTFETPPELLNALLACKQARVQARFVPHEEALPDASEAMTETRQLALAALRERLDLAAVQGAERLRRLGVEVVTNRRVKSYLRRSKMARSITS